MVPSVSCDIQLGYPGIRNKWSLNSADLEQAVALGKAARLRLRLQRRRGLHKLMVVFFSGR